MQSDGNLKGGVDRFEARSRVFAIEAIEEAIVDVTGLDIFIEFYQVLLSCEGLAGEGVYFEGFLVLGVEVQFI